MDFLCQLNNDISRYAIPFSCKQCTRCFDCYDVCEDNVQHHCKRFVPSNMDMFLNDVIRYFETNTPVSKKKRLSRVCSYNGVTNDKVTPLDTYYVGFINDSVKELSLLHTVYIFNIYQLYDIIMFCRGFTAKYIDNGIIALTKEQ